jgi:hypothetical protein
MKTRYSILLVTSTMLIFVLAACNMPAKSQSNSTNGNPAPVSAPTISKPPSKPASNPTAQKKPTKASQSASSGACANPYYPSTLGSTWTYANTSPMAPNSTTTRTISDNSPAGFITHDTITPDITVTIKWNCKDGNLTMLESATASAKNIAMAVSSANASGYLIPADLSAGKTWSEKLGFVTTGDIGGKKMTQQNDIQIACTANGKAKIQVQAGKFDAFKVTCVYNMTSTTEIDGNPGKPINNTINMTDWYVSGVGSVKTEKTGDIIESHELTSYSIA